MRTDDPIADFEAFDRRQQKNLEKLPKCAVCDEPIQQEYAVNLFNRWCCDHCLDELRKLVGDA